MKAAIRKWGNSASVRIPTGVLRAANLEVDDAVEVREEAGRVVIEPLRRKEYDLGELIKGISARNLHDEADFGGAVGKEVW